jgi:hypothetical protein
VRRLGSSGGVRGARRRAGELADDQRRAADVSDRKVEAALSVGEDAHLGALLRQAVDLGLGVAFSDAGQEQQAAADGGDCLAVDGDGSTGDALEDDSHGVSVGDGDGRWKEEG